jgi:hypothetical protein
VVLRSRTLRQNATSAPNAKATPARWESLDQRSDSDELDPRLETPEVAPIGGQQPGFAVRQHGRDDVGVVHLAPSHGNAAAEIAEKRADLQAVLENVESRDEARSTSANASTIGSSSLSPPGRVTTDRYSRITCRLMAIRASEPAVVAKAATARAWSELVDRVE